VREQLRILMRVYWPTEPGVDHELGGFGAGNLRHIPVQPGSAEEASKIKELLMQVRFPTLKLRGCAVQRALLQGYCQIFTYPIHVILQVGTAVSLREECCNHAGRGGYKSGHEPDAAATNHQEARDKVH